MSLTYRNPAKMAARRDRSLDALAGEDSLIATVRNAIAATCKARGEPISEAMVAYYTRKRAAVRASYFRQRYGRDYWTGTPRHPNRAA